MKFETKVDPFFVPVKVTANGRGGKTYNIPTDEMKPEELAEMADTWRASLFEKAGLKDPQKKDAGDKAK